MNSFSRTLSGLKWMGVLKLASRIVSFVRIAILARLLVPSDFGLFGIASLALAFSEIITETGVNVFLIQQKNSIRKYINTAFLVSVIRGVLIFLILAVISYPVAMFFETERAYQLILVISLVPLIRGFINPMIITIQKELKFKKEFYLRFVILLIDSSFSILFTLLYRSVYGLFAGIIIGAIAEVILSFIYFERPKLEYDKLLTTRLLKSGKWVTLYGIFNYLFEHGDDVIVGKLLSSSNLGIYQMSYRISTLPISEVSEVLIKVNFPVFSKIARKKNDLYDSFIKSTTLNVLLVLPISLTIFFFPDLIVKILLGGNWMEAAPLLKVLAVFGFIRSITHPFYSLFLAVNKQKLVTYSTFISLFIMAITIFPLVYRYGLIGSSLSVLLSSICLVPYVVYNSVVIFSSKKYA